MNCSAFRTAAVLLGWLALGPAAHAAPRWIWAAPPAPDDDVVAFRHEFDLAKGPDRAVLKVTADNGCSVYLNGRSLGEQTSWEIVTQYDVTAALVPGRNVLAIRGSNGGGAAGLAAEMRLTTGTADAVIESGPAWKCLRGAPSGWVQPGYVMSADWKPAADLGEFGKAAPWGDRAKPSAEMVTIAERRTVAPDGPFELKDGDTVVFLGDTFLEREYNYGFLESALTAAWPDRKIRFRNLSWSGDTPRCESRSYFGKPEEGFARLRTNLQDIRPTVVICCYGAVDAFEGAPGVPDFIDSTGRLLDMIQTTTGAAVVLLGPPPARVSATAPKHAEGLAKVSGALQELAKERGLRFGALDGLTASLPADAYVNGVTLTETGYSAITPGFLNALGVNGAAAARAGSANAQLRAAVVAKNRLFFHRWRPQNETYLFGFRKHEQGRNGAEIPMFDPLIDAREKEIAALLKQGPL